MKQIKELQMLLKRFIVDCFKKEVFEEEVELPDWNAKCSCKSKICQLQFSSLVVDQQILRLQIAMQYVAAMAV